MVELYTYQRRLFNRVKNLHGFAFFMDCGTGKTPVAIELIKHHKERTLVICKRRAVSNVWIPHLKTWAPHLKVVNGREKDGHTCMECDVWVVNYEKVRKYDDDFFRAFSLVILDESHKIKSVKAKITKFILARADLFKHRYVLSGSPAPNTQLEYWPQMNFVNPYILNPELKEEWNKCKLHLNRHYYAWRMRYFYNFGFGGYLWKCTNAEAAAIMQRIKRQAVFLSKDDCLDLPPQVFIERSFKMDGRTKKIYEKMEKENIAKYRKKEALAENELVEIMKLRQITSGFFIDEYGQVADFSDAKYEILEEVLEEIGDKQAIIWTQFHHEVKKICEMKQVRDCHSLLIGNMSDKKADKSIYDFSKGLTQYLVAHPGSGGESLNFTNCTYNVFFSQSHSLLEWDQAISRTHRAGQTKKVTYISINAENTIDGKIYKAVRRKESVSKALLSMLRGGF